MTFKKIVCILLLAALGIYILFLLSVSSVIHDVKDDVVLIGNETNL